MKLKNNETILRLTKKAILFDVLCIILFILLILLYSLCCPVLNLNDCYDVRYDGNNGCGVAVVVDITNRGPRGIYAIDDYTDFPLSKSSYLSNGDTIELDFDISLTERLEFLFEWGIRLKAKPETIIVEGLPELNEIDPFKQKDLTLNFIGLKDSSSVFVDMDYKVERDTDKNYENGMSLYDYNKHNESPDNWYKFLHGGFCIDYSLINSDTLKLGDEIIVNYEDSDEKLKAYGQTLTTKTKTYTVTAPTCYYVQSIADLSERGFSSLVDMSPWYDEKEIEYYFFRTKEPNLTKDYNFICLIHKVNKDSDSYYNIVKIPNVCMDENGNLVSLGQNTYKSRGTTRRYATYIDGCEGTEDCRNKGCFKEELIEWSKDYYYEKGVTKYSSSTQTVYHNRLLETTMTE